MKTGQNRKTISAEKAGLAFLASWRLNNQNERPWRPWRLGG
jgi:hypothetical protein